MNRSLTWLSLLILAMTGCSDSVAETYCSGLGACFDKVGGGAASVSQGRVDECVDEFDAWLDGLSEADREEAERPVEQCAEHSDCAFVVCYCEATDSDAAVCDAAAHHL